MYSKRIVIISIIVIGCLVHFITCPTTPGDKKRSPKSPSKPPAKAANAAAARPRALPPNAAVDPKGNANANVPTKPAAGKPAAGKPAAGKPTKPPAAEKKKEPAENTADDPGGDEDPEEEKPTGRIRKVFRRINNFRKKICPFRFFGRLVKKGFRSIKPKPTDDE